MDDVERCEGARPTNDAVDAKDAAGLRAAVETERARTIVQIANLARSLAGIVDAAELTSTDDEHDPEGATIAYERAQVSALLRQARADLGAFDDALARVDSGTVRTCAVCDEPITISRLLALPGARTCIRCAM